MRPRELWLFSRTGMSPQAWLTIISDSDGQARLATSGGSLRGGGAYRGCELWHSENFSAWMIFMASILMMTCCPFRHDIRIVFTLLLLSATLFSPRAACMRLQQCHPTASLKLIMHRKGMMEDRIKADTHISKFYKSPLTEFKATAKKS